MEKSRTSKGEGQDRLSELPESLIFHIFSLMAMTDVVRTTVLSNRWKNLWTTAPCLNFKDFKIEIDDTDDVFLKRVENFIKRVLIFWRGARIQGFKIDFGKRSNKSIYDDIDLWLQFAKEYKVERLYVYFGNDSIQPTQEMYWVPQCLYSCSSLKMLHLDSCNFHIPIMNVNWNIQLKYLNIDGYGLSNDLINKVLLGSPQLEVFVLYLVDTNDNLSIKSTSLKDLFIDKHLYDATDNPSVDAELRISTPNLERLDIGGVPYSKCVMNNVPSLVHANLMFDGPLFYSHQLFCGNDFVGETLRQILPTIQHVRRLVLSDWSIKALGDMKNKNMLSPFQNVDELELNGCFEEYEQIVSLLEIFPELKRLVLEQEKVCKEYHRNQHQHGRESVKFEANLPNSFLQKLGTIVIMIRSCIKIELFEGAKLQKKIEEEESKRET